MVDREALNIMIMARSNLLVDNPFFGTIAMFLKLVEDEGVKTMGVDGVSLFYAPSFVKSLSKTTVKNVVIHEICHIILKHHVRMCNRDHKKWNVATDYAINLFLHDSNIPLTEDALLSERWRGMSAEMVYAALGGPTQQQQESAEAGQVMQHPELSKGGGRGEKSKQKSKSDESGDGTPEDGDEDGKGAGAGMSVEEIEALADRIEAQVNSIVSAAASAAKSCGKLPAGLSTWLTELLEPKVNWEDVLASFVDSYAKNDYSWARQSRAMMRRGLIGPALHSEELGNALVVMDLSGSIGTQEQKEELAEVFGILDRYDVNLTLATADTEMYMVGQWERGDIPEPRELELRGGGGTSLDGLIAWVEENEIYPRFCIYLTDAFLTDWGEAPNFPLLVGILPGGTKQYVPEWARVIEII